MRPDDGADLDDVAVGGADGLELLSGKRIEPLGHVQPAVRRCTGEERIDKGHRGRRAAAADPSHAVTGSGRMGMGRPSASTATRMTSASVTLTFSPRPIPRLAASQPHRSASTSMRMVTEVRPTLTTDGKKL